MDRNVVIGAAVRTPFDKFGGLMKSLSSIELGRVALEGLMERAKLPKAAVEEIFYGSCVHAETGQNLNIPARQAMLKAGFPPETLSCTVDRACCSSMYAVELAFHAVRTGQRDVVIAAGSENMSNVPYLVSPKIRWGCKAGDLIMDDEMVPIGYREWNPVAVDAGNVAVEYGVTREEQDRWAVRSQQRGAAARAEGKFAEELVPLRVANGKNGEVEVGEDQTLRPNTTYEDLARLPTVYGSPTVTAGNAPGMNAGASAILILSEDKADALGITPLAYIRAACCVADQPNYIPRVPATTIQRLLESCQLSVEQLRRIEINEAFAAMPLVSTKILGGGEPGRVNAIRERTNVNGGAIALGHPLGATGARLVMTLMYELRRIGGGFGAAAICGGLAQGDGVLLEVVQT